ncbi:MAG: AAA family ATPase [Paenibacillaceae bacterium]|nr:AAA family ATPase [Paenibacillaceae bacterium]
MKDIRLLRLTLRNFKGITEFTFAPNGHDAAIYGDNATGKTTQYDAFNWLLFGKDSSNRSKFSIKPLDERGNAASGTENEVEGVLLVDGKKVTLRRVHKEKWEKKRGAIKAEMTGHTTDYYVDGVPKSEAEYMAFIAGIVDEKLFKLLTSPGYFNEIIDMKERRQALFDLCGDLTDADVIASNPTLGNLPAILDGAKRDDHTAKVKARCKVINDEIKDIPVRISEATRSKPDVSGYDEDCLSDDIAILQKRIESKETELVSIQSGGEVQLKTNRLREIEGELLTIKNRVQAGSQDVIAAARKVLMDKKQALDEVAHQITAKERVISQHELLALEKGSEADRLRIRYTTINSEPEPQQHSEENCPACGQSLPAERIEAAHAAHVKAIADYRRDKSERLGAIREQGKAASTGAVEARKAAELIIIERDDLVKKGNNVKAEIEKAESEYNHILRNAADVNADPEYIAKQAERSTVEQEIATLRASTQEAVAKAREELAAIRTEKQTAELRLALFAQARKLDVRISELKSQEKLLAAEFEKLQEEIWLLEEFTKTKVNMLESAINAKFKLVEWKLFEVQVNGSLKEVCESTYRGVPYGTGLNHGMQTNLNLDIINTLAKHYDLSAPIFIDNAESVTELVSTVGQQVKLIVPPSFDNLPLDEKTRLSKFYGSENKAREEWSRANKKLRVEVKEAIKEAV